MKKVIPVLLTCLLYHFLQAQITVNQWTWVNGDNTVNKNGVYGTKGVGVAGNKPGARLDYISWMDGAGNFWIFGGHGFGASGGTGYLNDLWKFNPSTNIWTWMAGSNAVNALGVYGTKGVTAAANWPGARGYATSVKDASGKVWMFGGSGYGNSGALGYLNDLWSYDIASGQWTWKADDSTVNQYGVYGTKGSPAAANKPGSGQRGGEWIDVSGNIWLFGGATFAASGLAGNTNDLWKYDTTAKKWTWICGDSVTQKNGVYGNKGVYAAANTPGVRLGSVCWTDTSSNLWLFDGAGLPASGPTAGYMNDLWQFNPTLAKWRWVNGDSTLNHRSVYGAKTVPAASNLPGSRYESIAWRDANNNVWLYGGDGYAASGGVDFLNDMWEYNINTGLWTWMRGDSAISQFGVYGTKGVSAAPNKPGARCCGYGWMDNAGNPWLFAGYGYAASTGSSYLNDLWGYQASPSTLVFGLLPMEWLSFTATAQDNHALLNWQTDMDQPNGSFIVQRSVNGLQWLPIGTVATAGGDAGIHAYYFTDMHPSAGANYYRLQESDDGSDLAQTSRIMSVSFAGAQGITERYTGPKTVELFVPNAGAAAYRVSDVNGRVVQQGFLQNGLVSFHAPAAGMYVLQVNTPSATLVKKIGLP